MFSWNVWVDRVRADLDGGLLNPATIAA